MSLVLVGDAGTPGRQAGAVAAQLDRVLRLEHAEKRHPILLWLGNNVYPRGLGPNGAGTGCVAPRQAWRRRGVSALARAARDHIARGGDSYAALGAIDWGCRHPELELQTNYADGPHPWIMPAFHYVVRIYERGDSEVASSCSEDHVCTVTSPEPDRPALLDLVFVDTSPWTARPDGRPISEERASASLREMKTLLEHLTAQAESATHPRILVSSMPVESGGYHGLGGGGEPDATFGTLPPAAREAVRRGLFVGVVSGHERNLQVAPDISNAIKRSSKVWIEAPTFQIVSGAASRPDRGSARTLGFRRGTALRPTLSSAQPGFAVLRISAERVDAILHSRGSGWHRGAVSFPLHRPPHPVETPAPSMAPCRDCSEVPAGEQR